MFIIENDANHLNELNFAVSQLEGNLNNKYADEDWDCFHQRIAIPVIKYLHVQELKDLCQFITDEWLATAQDKPVDWNWHFPSSGRCIIPNLQILTNRDLRDLIAYCESNNVKTFVSEKETYVYLSFLYQQHSDLLHSFPEIRFEGNITILADNFNLNVT